MSGLVGGGNLRTDVHQEIIDKTPYPVSSDLVEQAQRIRETNVVEPYDRFYTTTLKTLPEFYDLLGNVLEKARELDGLEYSIRFTKEYPPMDVELPCFSVKLLSREPYTINGRQEKSFRYMSEEDDPDYPGGRIITEQKRMQNIVQLTVWAKTGKVMDELADWVEEKFFQYLWVLQWCGTSHPVDFLGRGEDIRREENRQEMYGAPLTIRVITGKIIHKRTTPLRKVAISLGILQEEDTSI